MHPDIHQQYIGAEIDRRLRDAAAARLALAAWRPAKPATPGHTLGAAATGPSFIERLGCTAGRLAARALGS